MRDLANFFDFAENLFRLLIWGKRGRTRISVTALGGKIDISVGPEEGLDEQIKKIETARDNLREALDTVDDLKSSAERHRRDVEDLKKKVEMAKREAQTAEKLKQMNKNDLTSLLQLETRRSRFFGSVAGFFIGIIASIVASFLFGLISSFFESSA